jgi:phospholipid/cholesterol/gamma-HCH transport system ATP-binding protein
LCPSGTGKSVLLKDMTGVLPPDEGEVIIQGENLWDLTPNARRERATRMGVLFQDGGMIGSLNIYDNTALPLRYHTDMSEREIKPIVLDKLTSVGLEDSLSKLPGEVSGGMRKRAAFARALVMDPSIVFFDEPDSGLDPIRTNLLNELILKMHREHRATYVLVTHYVATARQVSDYIALIWQGSVVIHGTADEVFESDDPVVRQFLTGDIVGPVGMK